MKPATFPYQKSTSIFDMPLLPVQLERAGKTATEVALVDSGAGMSVLPHQLGLEFGFDWANARPGIALRGFTSADDTRLVFLNVGVQPFEKFLNIFLWVKNPSARLILGQANFFAHFEITFLSKQQTFSLTEVGE
jgi:hypothetical protein